MYPKRLDWLIGNRTDTGVPEEKEKEFPAQVAGNEPRDVFIALPAVRAEVWQSLAKFSMVPHCNN